MQVVLDVNVLVSAVISSRGAPAQILRLWEEERFDLVVSPQILDELERVIHYPRIQQRYNLQEAEVTRFLQFIRSGALVVEPKVEITAIERDPSDNRYLECAVEGRASYIVSGDQHLLDLKEFEGIVILPPAGFVAVLSLQ
jgi:putative PIN family toxin of toxin-antitoxin system